MAWLPNWAKRIKLTISSANIDATLTNFPLNITLADSTGITNTDVTDVFSVIGVNSKKIAITTEDEITQCPVEIERWDATNEEANLWTKVPTIVSGTDTILYLYYDPTQPDNTTYIGDTGDVPAKNVWDSNFKAVWHMAQDPNGDAADAIKDSTSNANHGTPAGTMTSADLVDSKIGKAIDFDGTDDFISIGNVLDITTEDFTLEAIIKFVSTNNYNPIITKREGAATYTGYRLWTYYINPNTGYISGMLNAENASADIRIDSASSGYDDDSYHYAVFSADRDSATGGQLYIEGSADNAGDITSRAQSLTNTGDLRLGACSLGTYFAKGLICEVRISNIARPAAWIKATYYSNWNTLITYDSFEYYPINLWAQRIKLTIDHTKVNSVLYDFPTLITMSSESGITNTDVAAIFNELESDANRKKIGITTVNGLTQCPVEIERWSHADSEAFLWTKVPEISDSVDTILYLYYDANQSNNTSYVGDTTELPAQNVWDNGYSFVAHLSTRYESSTSVSGISDSGNFVTSQIGRGVWLDSANSEYLSCGPVISGSSYTFETFFKTSDVGDIILKDAVVSPMDITLTSGTLDFSISRASSGKVNNEGMDHSCSYVGGGACYNVSDNNAGTYWVTDTVAWNRVDLGVGVTKAIEGVQLKGFGYDYRMVTSFKIFGSNNDSDWDELYSDNATETLDLQIFTFDSSTSVYRYYRFNSYGVFSGGTIQMSIISYIGASSYSVSKTGTYNDNEYHFLTAVRRSNNNDLYLFVDGQTVSGTTDSEDYSNAIDPLLLGGSPGDYKTITFDEVRSSEVVRSRDWIESTYYSNMDNFITFDNPPNWYYYGYITEQNIPVSRQVRLYYRDTGALMGSTTSSGIDGYYYLTTTISGEHFIVVFDDDTGDNYNALILDKLLPRGIE